MEHQLTHSSSDSGFPDDRCSAEPGSGQARGEFGEPPKSPPVADGDGTPVPEDAIWALTQAFNDFCDGKKGSKERLIAAMENIAPGMSKHLKEEYEAFLTAKWQMGNNLVETNRGQGANSLAAPPN